MGLGDIAAIIENDNRNIVMADTWGHLAPEKNKTYSGRIVFAIGCFDSGDLNPTPLVFDLVGLSSSRWSYDAVNEWLQGLPKKFREEGSVYEWTGTFKNYKFEGTIKQVFKP